MDWNDPTVWSMIIAGVALVLSQLPPLREIIKGTKVKITNPDTFQLYHYLGSIHLTLFLDIHNIGGRSVVIDKLYSFILDENDDVFHFPAQSYMPRSVVPSESLPEFPVGRIILKPDERWYENTHFYKMWTEAAVEEVDEIVLSVRDNIYQKQKSKEENDGNWISTDSDIHQRVIQFFYKNFPLFKGNYRFILVALAEDDSVLAIKGYEFTLFESHIRTLKSYIDDYQYGAGIYFPLRDTMKYLWIRLRLIDNERRVRQIYDRLLKKL